MNVLHLSDLHFGIEFLGNMKEEFIEKRKDVLDKLIEKLVNLKKEWKPDIIVIQIVNVFLLKNQKNSVLFNTI